MGNEMLREAARDFLVAWERAESNRGCYATPPAACGTSLSSSRR